MKRKFLLSLLICCMVFSFSAMHADATEAPLMDVAGHAEEDAILAWVENGVLNGNDGRFRPDDPITRSELAAILNRVFRYQSTKREQYADLDESDWYYKDMMLASGAGVINGFEGKMLPDEFVTREQAAVIFTRAFDLGTANGIVEPSLKDRDKISDWAFLYVEGIRESGYMDLEDGYFHPDKPITRAEAVALLNRIAPNFYGTSGEYGGTSERVETVEGSVLVNSPGVTLKNMKIKGRLYLAHGIADGDVTLENVTFDLGAVAWGGKTVRIRDNSKGSVSFKGDTGIAYPLTLLIENGSDVRIEFTNPGEYIVKGPINVIDLWGKNLNLNVSESTVDIIYVYNDAVIDTGPNTVIGTICIEGPVHVKGKGVVKSVEAVSTNGSGSSFEKKPDKVTLRPGMIVTIEGVKYLNDTDEAMVFYYGLPRLLTADNVVVSDALTEQMYRYFREQPYELAMMPQFSEKQSPDWDELTLFVHLNYFWHNRNWGSNDYSMSKELFAETVELYFGDMKYTDRSSKYLTYENGVYSPVPGAMRSGHYRLTNISRDAAGVYTATFDGMFFKEFETDEEYKNASPNVKAIWDAAGVREHMQKGLFEDTVLSIFLKKNYRQILSMTEQVKIRFSLSGDDMFPFTYLSCSVTEY